MQIMSYFHCGDVKLSPVNHDATRILSQ
jgi:hypothetical protein